MICSPRVWADGEVLLRHGLRPGPGHRDRDLSGDGDLEQDGARLPHVGLRGNLTREQK